MPAAEREGFDTSAEDVLTPAEAATYLRVPEIDVLNMAESGMIPAQKIGGEWRFLRTALGDWLWHGERRYRKWHPEFLFERPFLKELVDHLEERLLRKLKAETLPKPGSKQAVLKHLGKFSDDDLEERLADARKRREAAG